MLQIQREIDAKQGKPTDYRKLIEIPPPPQKFYPWKIIRVVPAPCPTSAQNTNILAAGPSHASAPFRDLPVNQPVPSTSRLRMQLAVKVKEEKQAQGTVIAADVQKPYEEPVNTILAKRQNAEDFHLPELNGFLPEASAEEAWTLVDTQPNLALLVDSLRGHYFPKKVQYKKYNFRWSPNFVDQSNFKITPANLLVELNSKTLLKCSRGRLISVVLHSLIHISVYESSCAYTKQIYDHDINFMHILRIFNNRLNLEIGTDHTFLRNEDDLVSFKCNTCVMPHFKSVVKCPEGNIPPVPIAGAHKACPGQFHKVFEASRTINDVVETKYLMHKYVRFPKPIQHGGAGNVNAKPREIVDITDEDDVQGPRIENMVPIIDVEDNTNAPNRKLRNVAKDFDVPNAAFQKCPFCKLALDLFGGLQPHLDLCLG